MPLANASGTHTSSRLMGEPRMMSMTAARSPLARCSSSAAWHRASGCADLGSHNVTCIHTRMLWR
eukprot:115692-Chlamydomonas_euryale.AAC.6